MGCKPWLCGQSALHQLLCAAPTLAGFTSAWGQLVLAIAVTVYLICPKAAAVIGPKGVRV